MNEYIVKPLTVKLPELTDKVFDPEEDAFCRAVPAAKIDNYVWGQDYTPQAEARMAWGEDGLKVLLCAKEESISVKADTFNGPVYQDSCLECFLQPFEDDPRYINFEVNAGGTALIGFGAQRKGRIRLPQMPQNMNICASKHEGAWWAVSYTIPYALIESLFDGRRPKAGDTMKGNFYKCDESLHPHFGSWNPIVSEKPDFHRPECFGTLFVAKA